MKETKTEEERERKGKIQMVTSTDSQTFDKVAQFFNEREKYLIENRKKT